MLIIEILFWLFAGFLVLFYSFYFGLVTRSAKKSGNPLKQQIFPTVTLVIPTFNEGKVIQRKLLNTLELEYPKDALDVLVVDSASTDNTVELTKSFLAEHNNFPFRLLVQQKREGKASALNYCRPFCKGEIIVLTDADVIFRKDTLAKLVSGFENQSVGAISGKLIIANSGKSASTEFEKSYRDIFDKIRSGESNMDSTPIFNGPVSAFRKELMVELNPLTIADDTELSMNVREKGWKAIYEPRALAYEYSPTNFRSKNKQKIRRGQGIIQSFLWHKKMIFSNKFGKYGLVILPSEFFMHIISPILILAIIALAVLNLIFTSGFAILFFSLIGVLFLLELISYVPKYVRRNNNNLATSTLVASPNQSFKPINTLATFLNSQFNLIFSMLSLVFGRKSHAWEKIDDVRSLN